MRSHRFVQREENPQPRLTSQSLVDGTVQLSSEVYGDYKNCINIGLHR